MPSSREVEERTRTIEQPHHALLAEHRRGRRHPHVEVVALDGELDLAVLRAPALDDVHVGHDLDPADQRGRHRDRERQHFVQRTVGPDAHAHTLLLRLDVNVGAAVAHGLLEDQVDDLDDRRVLVDRGLARGASAAS